jgi:hypothetical protein
MTEFDPLDIFVVIFIIILSIGMVILISSVFFSFKAEVKSDEMERLNIELAENVLASDLTYDKTVFDAKKLNELETSIDSMDEKYHNIELPFKTCSYGYGIKIESAEQECEKENTECGNFCRDICGLSDEQINYGENCKCDKGFLGLKKLFGDVECQCKKPGKDEWLDRFKFSFGYVPDEDAESDFAPSKDFPKSNRYYPVAVANINDNRPENFYETIYPARMYITLYDSFLTRAECLVEKVNMLKDARDMSVLLFGFNCDPQDVNKCLGIKKSGDFDNSNYICMFDFKDVTDENSIRLRGCRYSKIPVLPFMDKYDVGSNYAKLVAYPVKSSSLSDMYKSIDEYYSGNSRSGFVNTDFCRMSRQNCEKIKQNPDDYIAKSADDVGAIVLCLDAEKKDDLCLW